MKTRAMLYFFSLISVACLLLSCGSCSKKADCPGYKDTMLDNLFPYTNNQRLLFKNNVAETVFFTLRNTETTQPYEATSGGVFSPGPVCEARKVFESDERDSGGQKLFSLMLSGNSYQHSADLRLKQNNLSFFAYTDTAFAGIAINNVNTTLKRFPTAQIGTRNFIDVTIATRDTSSLKTTGIFEIYYAKGEGLVGYAEYPSLKTWVKQ